MRLLVALAAAVAARSPRRRSARAGLRRPARRAPALAADARSGSTSTGCRSTRAASTALLRADRGAIWRHLRDDAAHDLEQLAERRGLTAARGSPAGSSPSGDRTLAQPRLPRAHPGPPRASTSSSTRCTRPRSRRPRGTSSARRTSGFLALRRAEHSPLQIGRLHGRTTAQMHRRAVAVLRARARKGSVSARSARARRGCCSTARSARSRAGSGRAATTARRRRSGRRRPLLPPADYANNPSISDDGDVVVWDAYRAKIPEARIARGDHRPRRARRRGDDVHGRRPARGRACRARPTTPRSPRTAAPSSTSRPRAT